MFAAHAGSLAARTDQRFGDLPTALAPVFIDGHKSAFRSLALACHRLAALGALHLRARHSLLVDNYSPAARTNAVASRPKPEAAHAAPPAPLASAAAPSSPCSRPLAHRAGSVTSGHLYHLHFFDPTRVPLLKPYALVLAASGDHQGYPFFCGRLSRCPPINSCRS